MDFNDMPLPEHPHPDGCSCVPCAAYLRVSKVGDRGDDLLSPELQLHANATAAHAAGQRIVRIITDIDKSGRDFSKRRMTEMADDVRAGLYRRVWVYRWDRWGRNPKDSLIQIDRLEKLVGGYQVVQSATEPADTETTMGEFTRDQLLVIARLQSNMIRDGWKLTHAKRRRESKTYNGTARFGYRHSREAGYEIEPVEAEHLRDAVRRVIAGEAFLSIASDWNARGIKTIAARRPNKPSSGTWTQQTLKLMLETGFHAGLIRERKKPTAETRKTRRSDSFDVWREGTQPKIITDDDWTAFKAVLTANKSRPARWVWPARCLSGMLVCALCEPTAERKMVVGNAHGKQRFICPRRRDNKLAHRHFSIMADMAEDMVLAWLASVVEGGEDIQAQVELAAKASNVANDIEDLDCKLTEAQAESLDLSKQVLKKLIPESDAVLLRAELDQRLNRLAKLKAEAELAKAEAEGAPLPEFTTLIRVWPELGAADQRRALAKLVRHFVVWPSERPRGRCRLEPITRW